MTAPSATYICSGDTSCCCNAPIQHASPAAGRWPGCAVGYECVAMQPGGVIHPNPAVGRIDVNLCRSRLASPGFTVTPGNNVYINLEPDTRADTERLFNALAAGGTIEMPLQEMFWGDYSGSLVDRFGVHWQT